MPRLPNEHWDAAAVAAMHTEFARTREPQLRARLTVVYQPFARHFALRYRNSSEPLDDLVQVAMLGLVNAIDRYDPSRGSFRSYAGRIIIGELKRHFRDKTWAVRVPRAVQERYLAMKAIVEVLRGELGRSPTIPELAARLEVSDEDVLEAMEAAALYRIRSLDESRGSDDERADEAATPEPGYDAVERQVLGEQVLGAVLHRISERERELLHLYYVDGLTQAEIASRVGTSQVSVSRHLSRTIDRLRALARV